MSEMEIFCGWFKESDKSIVPEDTDDFYDLEEEHGCHFVMVDNILYEFHTLIDLNSYGFSEVLPPCKHPIVLCYWYNGGAGLHEVVEDAIQNFVERNS